MHHDPHTALRGFDSYQVRLGDELRGHRATLGRSLLDVQRDLRIKAAYIDSIENCDASVIPNKGFVAGYVRAYARYLDLDPDAVYARFCAESGFAGQGLPLARPEGRAGGFRQGRDPALARSHFAAPVGRARPVGFGVSPSDLASVTVLGALVVGLGWGGLALLRDIQRVQFAPLETPPGAVASAPAAVAAPGLALQAAPAIDWAAADPAREEALASLYAPAETPLPSIELRDGPIVAIDPARSGLFPDPPSAPPALVIDEGFATADGAAGAPVEAALLAARLDAPAPAPDAPAADGLWLVFTEPCWVQVKAADGVILVERIFDTGERWRVPDDAARPRLRAGNAGGILVEANGRRFGPLGRGGEVLRSVTLEAEAVAAAFSETPAVPPPAPVRAEASLSD